jgi:hypothetical protein
LLWCSDGWVYDTVNKTRRQFFSTEQPDVFRMVEETGIFVISDIQYQEEIGIKVISSNPRKWQEGTDMFCVIDTNS